MSDKITPEHRTRRVVIYVRQSSPGQVRDHPESRRVQRKLAQRARDLGWSDDAIYTFEGDLGESAGRAGARSDFQTLVEWIKDQRVGLVLGVDVSRLSRNAVDWSLLTYWCAVHGVLMGDQTQVLDPASPPDSLILGIQGVLAVHELHGIRQRLTDGLHEKASRGELYHGIPKGYVVVDRRHLRKHPDPRVQRTVAQVLDKFRSCASVYQLLTWLQGHQMKLPSPVRDGEGLNVNWVEATYPRVREMLDNPFYAGIYVYPRYKTEMQVDSGGEEKKRVRRARPEDWDHFLPDHHPAYIGADEYEANQEKLAMNAQRYAPQTGGAAHAGAALLSGLITCRRCQHKMQVSYGKRGVSYACRQGRRQRAEATGGCLRFPGQELERQLSEQILYAVSPAGVAAAELAAQRLGTERAQRRQALEDDAQQARYEADLARRRFDHVDPSNVLVLNTLGQEWEAALQTLRDHEDRLEAFDRQEPPQPTSEQRARLEHLGAHLDEVWFDPQTDGRLRKQIVRTLIEHVYADWDEEHDEVVLWVQWAGGHHTELRAPRRRRSRRTAREDLKSIVATLRKVADDEEISRALNRSGLTTERGQTWTVRRVAQYRKRHGLASFSRAEQEREGWVSQHQAATYLQISPMSVNRLIGRGLLPAEGPPGFPRVLVCADLDQPAVQKAVKAIRSHANSPLPENPKQRGLFPETTYDNET